MTKFRLSGVFSPIFGESSFLIPFFMRVNTNDVFVQDLDEDFVIRRFLKAHPTSFKEVFFNSPFIEKEVGEQGLLSYKIGNSEPQVSEAKELRFSLERDVLCNQKNPFFNVEAYTFLGNEQMALRAIDCASELFGNPEISKTWKNTEKAVTTRLLQQGHSDNQENREHAKNDFDRRIEQAVKELIERGDSHEWPKLWMEAWVKFRHDERIQSVAHWWIAKTSWGDYGVPAIISKILSDRRANDLTVTYAIDWSNEMHNSSKWYGVWYPLNIFYTLPSDKKSVLLNIGWRYLNSEVSKILSRRANQWSRVWIVLARSINEQDKVYNNNNLYFDRKDLEDAAYSGIGDFMKNDYFVSNVVVRILQSNGKSLKAVDRFFDPVNRWLLNRQEIDATWVKVYKSLPTLNYFREVTHRATGILYDFDIDNNLWAEIWETTWTNTNNEEELYGLAIEWLKSTSNRSRNYAKVLASVLRRRGIDGFTALLAEQWLSNQSHESREKQEIQSYLGLR